MSAHVFCLGDSDAVDDRAKCLFAKYHHHAPRGLSTKSPSGPLHPIAITIIWSLTSTGAFKEQIRAF
ncbi:uncharacterized protein ARMOST_18593 [Armillaria ostoyae]|uniref:Uncharacterized protein n=1 Tax=Armillaria ostoyae TaxID=47428 RepID=A0A284S252_ARMOS|nr:uncharacterized protein ARMOST_18593 [Armillaria ostoyae]